MVSLNTVPVIRNGNSLTIHSKLLAVAARVKVILTLQIVDTLNHSELWGAEISPEEAETASSSMVVGNISWFKFKKKKKVNLFFKDNILTRRS